VAVSVAWQTTATVTTTAATVYTLLSTTAASYAYARDLVLTNAGTATVFVGVGVANVATSVASFGIPAGGTLLLTQCQANSTVNLPISACTGTGNTSSVSVGFATNIAYI
jgi:hypothetical protein